MVEVEYAKALFSLAEGENKLEDINNEFSALVKLLSDNLDYYKVLTYPNITLKDKKESVSKTFKSFTPLFIDFLYVLLDNNRFNLIESIYKEYKELLDLKNNVINVDVYSASMLNDKQKEELKKTLSQKFIGKTLVINNILDDSLIGGIKVIASGKQFDISLKSRILDLKNSL